MPAVESAEPRRTGHAAAFRSVSSRSRRCRYGPRGRRAEYGGPDEEAPQAFVMATLSDPVAADFTTFGFTFQLAVSHLASEKTGETSGSVFVDANSSSAEARASLNKGLKQSASSRLSTLGETVPADRIAVVLL